uniref:Uncharacterized protein n=1 Tax=Knipowitschia caucasica TaxID=637954 RepID=A0AAV2KDL9_KNICA
MALSSSLVPPLWKCSGGRGCPPLLVSTRKFLPNEKRARRREYSSDRGNEKAHSPGKRGEKSEERREVSCWVVVLLSTDLSPWKVLVLSSSRC